MAEDNVTPVEPIVSGNPTPPAEPPVAPPALPPVPILNQPVSVIKPDGTFADNWRDTLPEDLRNDPSLGVIKTFPDLAKRMVNAVKMVGKDKIVVPTDKSKPEEWESFYTAIGRPPKAEDFKAVEVPEDLKEIFDDNRIGALKKAAFDLGATQKQFDAYLKTEIEQAQAILAEQDKLDLQARQDAEKSLRTEFGAAYDERIHVANRLIAEAFPVEEEKMNFLEKFGADADFIRFASRIGSRMTEHTALIAELTHKTTADVQKRINELNATPGYMTMDNRLTKEQRQAITDEIRELQLQLNPAKKAG